MVIRTKTVPGSGFLYRKQRVETDLPDKAFQDVRLDQDEPIYVSLIFPGSTQSVPYLSILEDNPYESLQMDERYGTKAAQILTHMEKTFLIEKLNREIDLALEALDQERFYQLTSQLKDVLKTNDEQ